MPNIRTFENPINGITPSDKGIQAEVMEGRHIGSMYSEVGNSFKQIGRDVGSTIDTLGTQYQEHVTRQELLTGLAQKSQLTENLTQAWQKAVADDAAAPTHDPHLFDKFKDSVLTPTLSKLDDGFSTKQSQLWWGEQKAALAQHFTERGIADVSSLAGHQAVQDFQTTSNNAQSLAYQDPTSADLARGTVQQATGAAISSLGANATPEAIAALKTHGDASLAAITLAQGHGMVDSAADPVAAAKQFVDKPEAVTHLNQEQRDAVLKYGESQARVKTEQQKAAEAQQRLQMETEGKAAFSQLRVAMTDDQGTFHPTPAGIQAWKEASLRYGSVLPGEVSAFGNAIEEANRRAIDHADVHSDPTTYSQLAGKVQSGGLQVAEVDRAYAAGLLSDHDYTKLHEMRERVGNDPAMKELFKRRDEFLAGVKPVVGGASDPMGNLLRADGAQRYYLLQSTIQDTIDAKQHAGEKPDQIMRELFTPGGQEYFGNRLGHFVTASKAGAQMQASSPMFRQNNPMLNVGPGGPPKPAPAPAAGRLPNESPEAYLRRTGG